MTDRSEERNAGRQEMNDCMSECRNAILLLESHGWADSVSVGSLWMASSNFRPQLARRDGIQIAEGHTYIHAYSHTDRHTYMVTYVHSYRHTYMQTVGPETSFKPGLGAMEIACNAMEIAAKQTLCEEASLEAGLETGLETGLEAMEIAIGCYGNCSKGERLG